MPLDPQVEALLAGMKTMNIPTLVDMAPQEARVAFAQMAAVSGPPEAISAVDDRTIPGVTRELSVRVYTPSGERPLPAMVFFHGGGWVIGDLETHDALCRSLANSSGNVIVAVDYPLAPENKFPVAVEECYAAAKWVADHARDLAADPARIGVGGDSAGGNLAAVVTLLARERGGPPLAYQMLIYPALDMTMAMPSVQENGVGYFLTSEDMVLFCNQYIRVASDKVNQLVSPLLAPDLTGLPPAVIVTAEFDPLRDEGEAYGERLRQAGVPVALRRYDGMIHGFLSMGGAIDRARLALQQTASDLRAATVAGMTPQAR